MNSSGANEGNQEGKKEIRISGRYLNLVASQDIQIHLALCHLLMVQCQPSQPPTATVNNDTLWTSCKNSICTQNVYCYTLTTMPKSAVALVKCVSPLSAQEHEASVIRIWDIRMSAGTPIIILKISCLSSVLQLNVGTVASSTFSLLIANHSTLFSLGY